MIILSSNLEHENAAGWLIENGIDANVGTDSALILAISKSL